MKNIIQNIEIKKYFVFVVLMLAMLVISTLYTNYKVSLAQKQYVVVDTDAISKQFLSAIIRANLPDEKYKDLLITYDKTLSAVINKVSKKNNIVILKKSAILTELPDVTQDVKHIVFTELKLGNLLASEV